MYTLECFIYACASIFIYVYTYVYIICLGYILKLGGPTTLRSVKKDEFWQPWAVVI